MDLLKSIRVFQRVASLNSFSAAARELNIVNSAVSRHITELEKRFDCKLLSRTTRSMSLTAEGRHYLQRFAAISDSVDALDLEVEQRKEVISGEIRITAPVHASLLYNLQRRLSQYMHQYPQVKLSWLSANRYVNLVEEGIDLAIRVGELPDSGMVAKELCKMHLFFAVSPTYLEQHGVPESPEQLPEYDCIVDSGNRQPARWSYKKGSSVRQVKVNSRIEVNNGELAADFAADGFGIISLPDFLLEQHFKSGRLVPILEKYALDPLPVSLFYPANRLMSPALRALIDALASEQ